MSSLKYIHTHKTIRNLRNQPGCEMYCIIHILHKTFAGDDSRADRTKNQHDTVSLYGQVLCHRIFFLSLFERGLSLL